MRVELDLLVADDLLDDAHVAGARRRLATRAAQARVPIDLEDAHLRVGHRGRVVVGLDLAHERLVVVEVEPLNLVLRALVLVDGLLVQHRVRAAEVHLGEHSLGRLPFAPPVCRDLLDDDEVVRVDVAERHVVRGVAVAHPVVDGAPGGPRDRVHEPVLRQQLEHGLDVVRVDRPEGLAGLEGQLERRTARVLHEDLDVVGVDARLLDGRADEVAGLVCEVLVERGARGDEHGERERAAPARPAEALPGVRDGPRIAGADDRVEGADVDAELERAGRHDATDGAAAQAALDAPARLGQVAAAVRLDARWVDLRPHGAVAQVLQHDLDAAAALAEDERRHVGAHQVERERDGGLEVARADAELGVHDGGVVHEDPPRTGRRAALCDDLHRAAEDARRVLGRVSDGRRRRDEDGIGAVKARDADEPAQHVREVRAEDAPVGVQLVDDHVAEVREEARPARVVREDAGVEHVRVGEEHAAPLPGRAARVPRGVAVVGDGAVREAGALEQPAERLLLVTRERLRREEVERPGRRPLGERLHDGEVVTEALAGRRGRRDDEVTALACEPERLRLVCVEAADARLGERRPDRGGHRDAGAFPLRLRVLGLARRERAVEHDVPEPPAALPPAERGRDARLAPPRETSRLLETAQLRHGDYCTVV